MKPPKAGRPPRCHVLITALVAYHNRTGADMTGWFGLHEMPTKEKRLSD